MLEITPVEEIPWFIEVNGRTIAAGSSTPADPTSLCVGRLLTEGFMAGRSDLESLEITRLAVGTLALRAQVSAAAFERAVLEQRHRTETGCGLLHFVNCDPAGLRRSRSIRVPESPALANLLRLLFALCDDFSAGGGVHGAALSDGRTLLDGAVDVSRHAAVDRVLGAAVQAGRDRSSLGLVLTSRISGQIAESAARAGVAWVASRSVPTTLAVAIAEHACLPMVARAASREARTFGIAP